MVRLPDLVSALKLDTGQFHHSTAQARDELGRFVAASAKADTGLSKLTKRLAVAAGAYMSFRAAARFTRDSVKLAAEAETLGVQFEVITGNATKAAKVMGQIKKFAASTPFQFKDIAQGGRSLLAFGVGTDKVLDKLKLLGNISAGSGARLSEIVSVYGKMKSAGVVSLGDINQLGDRAIPIFRQLQSQLGMSGHELRKFISLGKLEFPQVVKALETMTASGGMFNNALNKLSQTTAGKFSTLKDNISAAMTKIGESIIDNLNVDKFIDDLTKLAQTLANDVVPQISKAANSLVSAANNVANSRFLKGAGQVVKREQRRLSTFLFDNVFAPFMSPVTREARRLEKIRMSRPLANGQRKQADDDVAQARMALLNGPQAPRVIHKNADFAEKAKKAAEQMERVAKATALRDRVLGFADNFKTRGGSLLQSFSHLNDTFNRFRVRAGMSARRTPVSHGVADAVMAGGAEDVRLDSLRQQQGIMSVQQQRARRDEERNNILRSIASALTGGGQVAFDTLGLLD